MHVEKLQSWRFPEVRQTYDTRDVILYALSIGFGTDPLEPGHLRYVYEPGLSVFPTMAAVLASPGFWMADPEFGIDATAVLHGEQTLTIHSEIPVEGTVVGHLSIEDIVDKGDKGAFVYSRRTVSHGDTGDVLATLDSTTICRNDGGFGGTSGGAARRIEPPQGPPDRTCTLPTFPNSALLYRLNGDHNPLHADPETARRAGFEMPILHGLCTFGIAARALVQELCDFDASRLRHLAVRFSAPVLPGSPIVTRMWDAGDHWLFESSAGESGPKVLTAGRADFVD